MLPRSADRAAQEGPVRAPVQAWLFPATYMAHIAEELWAGEGFPSWASRHTGLGFTPQRFLALNGVVLLVMIVCAALATRRPSLRWLLPALAAAVTLNGLAHIAASLVTRSYSPGLLSGTLLWVPLGIATLIRCSHSLSRRELLGGVAAGLAAHAIITLCAVAISSVARASAG